MERRGLTESESESVFWMVQIMEAWFLADMEKLQEYYGPNFRPAALPGTVDVEQIAKETVLACLKAATSSPKIQKGPYHETGHAPHLLGSIRPERVRERAGLLSSAIRSPSSARPDYRLRLLQLQV